MDEGFKDTVKNIQRHRAAMKFSKFMAKNVKEDPWKHSVVAGQGPLRRAALRTYPTALRIKLAKDIATGKIFKKQDVHGNVVKESLDYRKDYLKEALKNFSRNGDFVEFVDPIVATSLFALPALYKSLGPQMMAHQAKTALKKKLIKKAGKTRKQAKKLVDIKLGRGKGADDLYKFSTDMVKKNPAYRTLFRRKPIKPGKGFGELAKHVLPSTREIRKEKAKKVNEGMDLATMAMAGTIGPATLAGAHLYRTKLEPMFAKMELKHDLKTRLMNKAGLTRKQARAHLKKKLKSPEVQAAVKKYAEKEPGYRKIIGRPPGKEKGEVAKHVLPSFKTLKELRK